MNSGEVRSYLKENIRKENEKYFGVVDDGYIDQVTTNWFNDAENYDGRWETISNRVDAVGKVLDMAAGCGTFVLNGLHRGYDVYGVEPEAWKREYFKRKIVASNYPAQWKERIIYAVGEALPFENESFDLITSYQTLEHVGDVSGCIQEMLRVLKRGGVLYIRAPDYSCFFEPHYRLPFLPKMNKTLAALYLKLIGRPLLGLETLHWTTNKDVIRFLNAGRFRLDIKHADQFYPKHGNQSSSGCIKTNLKKMLPMPLRNQFMIDVLSKAYELRTQYRLWVQDISMAGRREKQIDLWVTKIG